jgi:hypothetical protein
MAISILFPVPSNTLLMEHLSCQSLTHFSPGGSRAMQIPLKKEVKEAANTLPPAELNASAEKVFRFPKDVDH